MSCPVRHQDHGDAVSAQIIPDWTSDDTFNRPDSRRSHTGSHRRGCHRAGLEPNPAARDGASNAAGARCPSRRPRSGVITPRQHARDNGDARNPWPALNSVPRPACNGPCCTGAGRAGARSGSRLLSRESARRRPAGRYGAHHRAAPALAQVRALARFQQSAAPRVPRALPAVPEGSWEPRLSPTYSWPFRCWIRALPTPAPPALLLRHGCFRLLRDRCVPETQRAERSPAAREAAGPGAGAFGECAT